MHRELNVVLTDYAGKPRQPTSTGHVCHPRSLYRVCRSVYCQFHNDKTLCSSWLDYNVWSERRLHDVWKLQLFAQVCLLPVECHASLRCWLAYSLCLLWQTGWRWCQCFPLLCKIIRPHCLVLMGSSDIHKKNCLFHNQTQIHVYKLTLTLTMRFIAFIFHFYWPHMEWTSC